VQTPSGAPTTAAAAAQDSCPKTWGVESLPKPWGKIPSQQLWGKNNSQTLEEEKITFPSAKAPKEGYHTGAPKRSETHRTREDGRAGKLPGFNQTGRSRVQTSSEVPTTAAAGRDVGHSRKLGRKQGEKPPEFHRQNSAQKRREFRGTNSPRKTPRVSPSKLGPKTARVSRSKLAGELLQKNLHSSASAS